MTRKQTKFLAVVAVFAIIMGGVTSCVSDDYIEIEPQETQDDYRVSIEEAIASVNTFLNQVDVKTRGVGQVRKIADCYIAGETSSAKLSKTRSENFDIIEEPPVSYVINFENNQGFAIVSADKRTLTDIIAVTDEGYLNPEIGIDHYGMAMVLAEAEADFRRAADSIRDKFTFPQYTTSYTYYGRNSGVEWGQNYPCDMFTKFLRLDQYGYRVNAPAGCVAIALAQYLAWNKYPNNWQGQTYDWNKMTQNKYAGQYYYQDVLDGYDVPPFSRTDTLIGRLIEQINLPQWLDMDYQPDGSGAYVQDIPRVLKDMGYSNSGKYEKYDAEIVHNQLKAGYPVIAGGFALKITKPVKFLGITFWTEIYYEGGHAWLIERMLERTSKIETSIIPLFGQTFELHTYLLYHNWGGSGHNGYFFSGDFDGRYIPPTYPDENSAVINRIEGTPGVFEYNMQMIYGMRK